MSDKPVELSDEQALALLKRTEAEHFAKQDIPTGRQQIYHGAAFVCLWIFLAAGVAETLSFEQIYRDMDIDNGLPSITQFQLSTCHFLLSNWWFTILLIGGSSWAWKKYVSTSKWRMKWFSRMTVCVVVIGGLACFMSLYYVPIYAPSMPSIGK